MTEQPKVGVSSPNDIIAVFATEAEADAYLAGEADPELPDELTLFSDDQGNLSSWLPQGDKNYTTSKWRKTASTDTKPAAPKPVTWPDGVTEMALEDGTAVWINDGLVGIRMPGQENHEVEAPGLLAALLLAAADKVEGRG